ncbi:hypothetical protein ACH4VT_03340 [Streptomyces lydicus]|uniref:hypothetical protein n=1 Tax=Streptomyces lydicus TaxID=47763 RepID=UPI00378D2855
MRTKYRLPGDLTRRRGLLLAERRRLLTVGRGLLASLRCGGVGVSLLGRLLRLAAGGGYGAAPGPGRGCCGGAGGGTACPGTVEPPGGGTACPGTGGPPGGTPASPGPAGCGPCGFPALPSPPCDT